MRSVPLLTRRLTALLEALVLLFLAATSAPACSVPVFRYALERWEADAYPLIVFHRGPLQEHEKLLVERLRKSAANLQVVAVDVSRPLDRAAKALWEKQHTDALPYVVLGYPESAAIAAPAWSAPLDAAAVDALLDSPARRQIADRILKGESAVWVLLECGKPDRDDRAARLLQAQLKHLQATLKLPEPDDPVAEEILANKNRPALRIQFSLLRVPRHDRAERAFVSMLLHTEEDLEGYDEPLAFPIFGRGRTLEALVGKGISEDNIAGSCSFIIGACSCEVKRINPGKDLLMSVAWDQQTGAPPAREKVTDRTPGRRFRKPAVIAAPAPAHHDEPPAEDLAPVESSNPYVRYALYGVGGVVLMLFLGAFLRWLR